MSESQEFTARTVQQALIRASEDLEVPIEQLDYEVVDEKRRFLGFGGRLVRIRVSPASNESMANEASARRSERRPATEGGDRHRNAGAPARPRSEGRSRDERPARESRPPRDEKPEGRARAASDERPRSADSEPTPRARRGRNRDDASPERTVSEREAREFTQKVVDRMGLELDATAEWTDEHLLVDLDGPDYDYLLENGADALDALQYLVNSAFSRATGTKPRIVVDCDGYREERREELVRMALDAAEDVRSSGEKRTLSPMNPYDRRAVHLELNDEPDIKTYSVGEGLMRRIVVAPASSSGAGRSNRRGGRARH